jgi:hypothetical protein
VHIELILSKTAAGYLQRRVLPPMTEPAHHFIGQWRVEAAEDEHRGEWFMVTNCATFFTFLLPRSPTMRWPDLEVAFRTRLRFALLAGSPPADVRILGILPVKGNPRKVVGSMNEMCYLLASGCCTPDCDDAETALNRTPFTAIGARADFAFPEDVWHVRLNELASAGPAA